MGTDIHPVVQTKVEGKWLDVELPQEVEDILISRSYRLFALLANVRNGFGFAGVPTHDPIKYIAEPRGFPPDFADGDGFRGKQYLGDHSFTWVTLKELLDYDWEAPIRQVGVIPLEEFKKWDGSSQPISWSGGVWGGKTVTITQEDAQAGRIPPGEVYVAIDWIHPIKHSLDQFYAQVLEYFKTIGKPEEVRIVMGFDS